MPPTCMVTGAAGFIGSRLAGRMLREGWRVVGVDAITDTYDAREKLDRVEALLRHPAYRHLGRDLALSPLGRDLDGVEVVLHLAGRPGVRESFDRTPDYLHDNVRATEALVRAATRADSVRRLVYASSSSVYGDGPVPFREDGPTAPISPYGRTKLEAERICLRAAGDRLETVALRYFTVYGPGQRPDMAFRRFAEAGLAGRPLRLFGDGLQSRDFTFVDDVVTATRLAMTADVAGLAVNIGGGSRVTLNEVVLLLAELVGRPLRVEREAVARGDVRHTVADSERARTLLGFQPQVGIAEGLAREVEWLRRRTAPAAAPDREPVPA